MTSLPRKGTMRSRAMAAASSRVHGTMRLKLLVLGDAAAGKSSVLRRYNAESLRAEAAATRGSNSGAAPSIAPFDSTYIPTVGVDFVPASCVPLTSVGSVGRPVRVAANFFDMCGDASYAKVRAEFYADQHGLLLCFDVASKASWEHVADTWWPEATTAAAAAAAASAANGGKEPSMHVVVLGCKSDLEASRAVPDREVKTWCKNRGASYFECSAKTGAGVTKAIDYLIEHAQAEVRPLAGGGAAQPAPQQQQQAPPQQSSQRPPSASPRHSPQPSPSASSSSASSAGGGGAGGPTNISDLSLAELRRECAKRHISTEDCLEKSDVLARLREALARERSAKVEEASEARSREERLREAVLDDVARWARAKDIRSMLNDIHGWTEGAPGGSFLEKHASFAPVQIAYKKALLKIHPDKVDAKDIQAHMRATEMFKTVNAAFETFKKVNEKRLSGTNNGGGEGAAAGSQPQPSAAPSASPRTRPQQARR